MNAITRRQLLGPALAAVVAPASLRATEAHEDIRAAARRCAVAKATCDREATVYRGLTDRAARDAHEDRRLDPAREAAEVAYEDLCDQLRAATFSAVIVDGQVYVGNQVDDIAEGGNGITFGVGRLLNLDDAKAPARDKRQVR